MQGNASKSQGAALKELPSGATLERGAKKTQAGSDL